MKLWMGAREDLLTDEGFGKFFGTRGRRWKRRDFEPEKVRYTQLKRQFRYKRRQYPTIGLASKVVNLFLAQLKNITQWKAKRNETKGNEKSASLGKPAKVQCNAQSSTEQE